MERSQVSDTSHPTPLQAVWQICEKETWAWEDIVVSFAPSVGVWGRGQVVQSSGFCVCGAGNSSHSTTELSCPHSPKFGLRVGGVVIDGSSRQGKSGDSSLSPRIYVKV